MPLKLDYYYGGEAEQYSFYRIPKPLFTEESYQPLTMEAKVLYGLLLDRMSLSARNGWLDGAGRVYIFFTLEDAIAMLGVGHNKAVRLFRELEDIGLIERRKQGQGKPTVIYVKNFVLSPEPEQVPPPSPPGASPPGALPLSPPPLGPAKTPTAPNCITSASASNQTKTVLNFLSFIALPHFLQDLVCVPVSGRSPPGGSRGWPSCVRFSVRSSKPGILDPCRKSRIILPPFIAPTIRFVNTAGRNGVI